MKETRTQKRTRRARARFFLRIGAADLGRWRDENTLPLFTLPMIMDCEGVLAADARSKLGLVEVRR